MQRFAYSIVAFMWGVTWVWAAWGQTDSGSLEPSVTARVDATISADFSRISGTVTYRIPPHLRSDGEVAFWAYANRFIKGWEAVPVHEVEWLYPHGESEGRIVIKSPTVATDTRRSVPLVWEYDNRGNPTRFTIAMPSSFPATKAVDVALPFTVTVPQRRGRFGRHKKVLSLAGGWIPLLADPSIPGSSVPFVATVTITAPLHSGFVLNGTIVSSDRTGTPVTVPQPGRVGDLCLVVYRQMEVHHTAVQGVPIRFVTASYYPRDAHRRGAPVNTALRAMDRSRIAVTDHLVRTSSPTTAPLTLVEIPAWDHLVTRGENTVLVSDRLYRLLPVPAAMALHDRSVYRGVTAVLLLRQRPWTRRNHHAHTIADMGAYLLAEHRGDAHQSMNQMLSPMAFIPYVDNLIYAPQVPFAREYNPGPSVAFDRRDEPWRAFNQMPSGRTVAMKLVDIVGREAAIDVLVRYLEGARKIIDIVERDHGIFAARLLSPWLERHPSIAYRIYDVDSHDEQTGQYVSHITIEQLGDRIDDTIVVEYGLADGTTIERPVSITGVLSTAILHHTAPLKSIVIDPHHRVHEAPELTPTHPRFDNAFPVEWRPPLLSYLMVWVTSETPVPFVETAFSLKRKYDLSFGLHLKAAYTPTKAGGSIGSLWYRGQNKNLNSRTYYAGPYLSLYHYPRVGPRQPGIPDGYPDEATLAGITMIMGMNTAIRHLDAVHSNAFHVSFSYNVGDDARGGMLQSGSGSLRLFMLRTPRLRHRFALYGGGMALAGKGPVASLPSLSHRQILRGFDLNETRGQVNMYMVGEYRHTWVGHTPIHMPLGTHLSKIQGVLFAAAGSTTVPGHYHGLFRAGRQYGEVGYGVRFHFLALGVAPYLIAMDVAIPVYPVGRDRPWNEDDSAQMPQRAPLKLILGISQTY